MASPSKSTTSGGIKPPADRRCVRCRCHASDDTDGLGWRQAYLEGQSISWLCPDCALFVSSIVPARSKFWGPGGASQAATDRLQGSGRDAVKPS
jgi:hypothetical protein